MQQNRLWMVVGLGNPGDAYAKTRHNAGFMVVDEVAGSFSTFLKIRKPFPNLQLGHGSIRGIDFILVKPMTFMNRSGPSVKKYAKSLNISYKDMLVVHDDIDLAFGRLKIKEKGGDGGHKGIRSLIDAFGGGDFVRLRIGVGRPEAEISVTDHVLSRFNTDEKGVLNQVITMAQLKHALETNFEDTTTNPTGSAIQEMCLRAPKYGNDDPYVDNLAKDCLNIVLKELRQHQTVPGQGYGATIAPVAAHMSYGLICGATPDGRKAGTPLNDACSPSQGTDVNGPTATIKSVSNLEHINLVQGTIFNMKMHPGPLETSAGMAKWANLIRTYFDLGGWEVQFNVVSAETLKEAQQHPEDYKDLVVRVVGYSAFFVELEKAVQDDIIKRTEHGV